MKLALARFFATAALFSMAAAANAGSLTLSWTKNSEPNIAGYKLYKGTASGTYNTVVDVGTAATVTMSNLTAGVQYYFVVTAYTTAGNESAYSAELAAMVGAPSPTPSPSATPTPSATPSPTPSATPSPTASPTPSATPPPQYLLNTSTRVRVRGSDSVMIGGFIVVGDAPKDLVLRALGPSLSSLGVKRALANPSLEIYDSTGALITQNNDWTSLPTGTVPAVLEPTNPAEAVIVAQLAPGSYTAVLRSEDGSAGSALCELYDLTPGSSSLRNISTRGEVGSGDDVMIGGFILAGTVPSKVMVRAIGPSLADFGVTGALPDPVLELHGADGSLIYQNDNWQSDQATQITTSGILPTDAHESAIIATLAPGAYTAVVRDAHAAEGVALVEIYSLDPEEDNSQPSQP